MLTPEVTVSLPPWGRCAKSRLFCGSLPSQWMVNIVWVCPVLPATSADVRISLGDIHNVPTLWVLALFGIFAKFCFRAQTCHHIGGGGGGMCIFF